MKSCRACGVEKPLEDFHRTEQRKDGSWRRDSRCKPCARIKARAWYEKNQERARAEGREKARRLREQDPDGQRERERAAKLWRKYGITIEDWDRLYDEQLGRCRICHVPLVEVKTCVDHDHITGQVRGLLCNTCNQGLGYFSDDVERLQRAIDYLNEALTAPPGARRGGEPAKCQ